MAASSRTGEKKYTVHEIADLVGVTPATIRRYARSGAMPAPRFQGRGTRYSEDHVARARVIHELLGDGGSSFAAIKGRVDEVLAARSAKEIGDDGLPFASWQRVELVPGLELHVTANAGPLVRRLAREICREYAARALQAKSEDAAR